MTALIDMVDVCSGYGPDAPVLRGVSLHVDAGEVVALLGPNGAGKTTTLLTLSGMLKATQGTVCVAEAKVDPRRPYQLARRGVAHVPENRALVPGLSVDDNLRLGVRTRGASRYDVFGLFPALAPLRKRAAGLLSGGEQQMLAVARGMISSPSVVMTDELSLGLAPLVVKSLLNTVRRFALDTGAAVLLVEQHVHMALEVCDRAYIINRGRIVGQEAASVLLTQPKMIEDAYLGVEPTSPVP